MACPAAVMRNPLNLKTKHWLSLCSSASTSALSRITASTRWDSTLSYSTVPGFTPLECSRSSSTHWSISLSNILGQARTPGRFMRSKRKIFYRTRSAGRPTLSPSRASSTSSFARIECFQSFLKLMRVSTSYSMRHSLGATSVSKVIIFFLTDSYVGCNAEFWVFKKACRFH